MLRRLRWRPHRRPQKALEEARFSLPRADIWKLAAVKHSGGLYQEDDACTIYE